MKPISAVVGTAMLVLLIGVVSAAADSFQLTGAGTKIREHVIGNVPPGGSITVRIVNSHPGYAAFSLYLSGEDADGDEVIVTLQSQGGGSGNKRGKGS
jgi:hypothetical protein